MHLPTGARKVDRLTPPMLNEPVYPGATQTYGQTNTDWQDAYFKNGPMTQHNIGVSGGNEVSRFYASAGFMDQEGTTPSVAYRRYNFRLNSDHHDQQSIHVRREFIRGLRRTGL